MSNRHTFARVSVSALIAILGLSISMLTFAEESSSSTSSESSASTESSISSASSIAGIGTITIEQKNSSDQKAYGNWTLLTPLQVNGSGSAVTWTSSTMAAGTYTLIVTPPKGVTTSIRSYSGTEQVDYAQRPQLTFKLENGQSIRLVVNYTLTRTGDVSVQSDPAGIEFTITGPNNFTEKGITPDSFAGVSEGQYSVQFGTVEGCNTPAKMSQQLVEGGRASFSVTIACAEADKIRKREETKADKFVVISVDGADVKLRDVPQNAWFSNYVFDAARRGVISGYKDEAGVPTGAFGPSNSVTIAELAKMAHRLAGIGEESFGGKTPENPAAVGQWFSPFIASAENRGWTIYKDATIDPLRAATRSEVIITFLQVLDVPLKWQKGDLFDDVTVRTRFANAIETAARDGVIEGLKDEKGNSLHKFDPDGAINRAEISKIINRVFDEYKGTFKSSSSQKRN